MIISHRHKFVFIKTRKTAGSIVEHALRPHLHSDLDICTGSSRDSTPELNINPDTNGHLSYDDIRDFDSRITDDYWFFTIERNPWEKVIGSYFWHQYIKPEKFTNVPFELYVTEYKPYHPMDWKLYRKIFYRKDWTVFDYDRMDNLFTTLGLKYDINVLPSIYEGTRLKSGIRPEWADRKFVYNNETKAHVANAFSNEIEFKGYVFDE